LVAWEEGAVHHLLVARAADGARERLRSRLSESGIETGVHYPIPLSEQPALNRWADRCRAAELAAREVLSLPMDPLMTEDDVDHVSAAVCRASS
jgi:dTDP-4-amino-4,6-dideoxygalactose transaminase